MPELSFFARLWMAFVCFWQILLKPAFAQRVLPTYQQLRGLPGGEPSATPAATPTAPAAPRPEQPTETVHASGLFLLSMLQREGRLIDFVQEEVAPFSDAEVGAAARVVHEGCRKVLREYLQLAPVMKETEGAKVTVPAGFDAQRIRLTGNVTGQAPFTGALKHPGWVAATVKLPAPPSGLDPRVLAPAEVELS